MNEELSAIIKEKYLRVSREHPSAEIVDGKAPKPDLNQARTELAKVIGKFAEQFLAKKYGPLIGTVAESTAATYLQKFEENVIIMIGLGLVLRLIAFIAMAKISNPKRPVIKEISKGL